MLSKTGYNLTSSVISFLEKHKEVTLFSAYIRTEQLQKINQRDSIKQIIVRWDIRDICFGASDLELYSYCKENDIKLFRNTKIHLKAFWNNKRSVLFGSANVTKNGVGEGGNLELNGLQEDISFSDIRYFKEIISSSEYVTEELYNDIVIRVEENNEKVKEIPNLETKKTVHDSFLLSQLPMSLNIESIHDLYINNESLEGEELECLIHDLVLYDIPEYESMMQFFPEHIPRLPYFIEGFGTSIQTEVTDKNNFYSYLKYQFNKHPFIIALKGYVKEQEGSSLRYGGVVNWIQDNTTTVPTPRSWELKEEQIVNILYEWICFFDDDYYWERPNHSQVIFYKKAK